MVGILLNHGWRKFIRSTSFSRDLTTKIISILFGVMIAFYAVGLGYMLDTIIIKGLKQQEPLTFLNGLLFYYFLFDFVIRYMMQSLPVMDIQPYLHLPIRKSNMIHYLLVRSLIHVLNIAPLFIFGPFAFRIIAPEYGTNTAYVWLAAVWSFSIVMHFLVVLFKKKLDDNIIGLLSIIAVFGLLGAADYYQWFQLSNVSRVTFDSFMSQPIFLLAPLLVILLLYIAAFKVFVDATYPEEMALRKSSQFTSSSGLHFLTNFGVIGEMINVELKLILRNKRPRNMLFLSTFFLLYGLMFYRDSKYLDGSPAFLLFVGVFVTGIFMINYGQMLFSWQGDHFDFTLTRPLSAKQYVESKYWLLAVITIVCFVLSSPYVYFGWYILMINFAMMLFNIGVNIFIILNIAMWSPKKIDLKKGSTFNYEGIGAAQWLMSLPVMLGPYVFYVPFAIMGYQTAGILAVGGAGILGILFRNQLMDLTTRRLMERKYKIASGFRKD